MSDMYIDLLGRVEDAVLDPDALGELKKAIVKLPETAIGSDDRAELLGRIDMYVGEPEAAAVTESPLLPEDEHDDDDLDGGRL